MELLDEVGAERGRLGLTCRLPAGDHETVPHLPKEQVEQLQRLICLTHVDILALIDTDVADLFGTARSWCRVSRASVAWPDETRRDDLPLQRPAIGMLKGAVLIVASAFGCALSQGASGRSVPAGTHATASRSTAVHVDTKALPRVLVPWVLLDVHRGGAVLSVQYFFGGCTGPPTFVSTRVARRWVRISIRMTDYAPAHPLSACPSVARTQTRQVRLRAPIDGKRITGVDLALRDGTYGSVQYGPIQRDGSALPIFPRVIGLNWRDAEWVLRSQGLRPEIIGGVGRLQAATVISQLPAPHGRARESFRGHRPVVRLQLG